MASTAHKLERYSPYKISAVKQEWIEHAEQNKPDIIVIEAEVVKHKRIKRKWIKPEQNEHKPIIIDVEPEQLVRPKPKRIKSELQDEPEMIVIEPKLVKPERMKPKRIKSELQDEPEMIVIEPKLVKPERMKPKRIKSELQDEPEMIVIKSELVKPKPKRIKPEQIKTERIKPERIKPKSEQIKYEQPTQGMLNARPIFFPYHSETAGPDPYRDQIVQIAVTMLGDEPESFSSLIKPTHQEIGMWGESSVEEILETLYNYAVTASLIHGITNDDVQDKPHFKEAFKSLCAWMKSKCTEITSKTDIAHYPGKKKHSKC